MKKYSNFIFLLMTLASSLQSYGQEKLEIAGAIVIENSEETNPTPGTIRWTGSDFEGWNGIIWVSLTGGIKIGMVTDIDNNTYKTIGIGSQEWITENLRVTKYNDNTIIDSVTLNQSWKGTTNGAWCDYDNTPSYNEPYGKLYNWYAVNSGKLCPTGWHVPGDEDWTMLTDYLGGLDLAGGKIKEQGTIHWTTPNFGATNESGFTGLPGGFRTVNGEFESMALFANWWSGTESDSDKAWYRDANYINNNVFRNIIDKRMGFSVRCVRD